MHRFLLIILVAAVSQSAAAQTCTTSWTNPAGGAWETAANWDSGVPDATDVACITLAGTYTVGQSSSDRTIAGLVVGGAAGTQTLTSFNVFTILGDAVVRPSGRWEVQNRTPGGTYGVQVNGTLLVEGMLIQNGGARLQPFGGLLDVAPGGTLSLITSATAGAPAATFRVRGLVDGGGCTGTCAINGTLDV